jgi:hypothetical protein
MAILDDAERKRRNDRIREALQVEDFPTFPPNTSSLTSIDDIDVGDDPCVTGQEG